MALDDHIVDVSDPAAAGLNGAWALVRGAGNGVANAANLQLILDAALTTNPDTALAIYFPIGYWGIGDTVTWPNVNSFRVIGGGGMAKGLSQINAHSGSCTYIVWEGDETGPMFRIQNTDGDVWENLNFDGQIGPDTNASGPGDGLDVLIKHQRSGAGSGALWHHYKNCVFANAQKLFYAAVEGVGTGTAEFTFSKCLFNTGEISELHAWNSMAYYSDNSQSVNVVFDSNCEFNQCGYGAYLENTGRCLMIGPTIAIVGTLLCRNGGSQNTDGDGVFFVHIDAGPGTEGRKQLYKSVDADSTMGPVIIETAKFGAVGVDTDEFSEVTTFSGTNLTLTSPIRMRVGDRIAFIRKTDLDTEDYTFPTKVETTIVTRTTDYVYTTTDTAATLGIDDASEWYAMNGEALIECVSSDFVHLRNSFLSGHHIWGGRLARLTHSGFSTGRTPKFIMSNCMAAWGVPFTQEGVATLVEVIDSPAWWRFENMSDLGDEAGAPCTFGNFGDMGEAVSDINFERVPIERTFVLFPTEDEGLVAEAVKSFAIDSDPLVAVEFVHDMPAGGYIQSVETPVIESGPAGGLSFSTGRDKSQAKIRLTTAATGFYVVRQDVTYDDGSTASGKFSLEVVD